MFATGRTQQPQVYGSLGGSFIYLRPPAAGAQGASLPSEDPKYSAPEFEQAPPAARPESPVPTAPLPKGFSKAGQSAWVKLCEKATGSVKGKGGGEEKKELNICLTHHERLDGNTGTVLVSAAIRQVEGQEKQHFMVMVPLGMMQEAGMRATLYPKDAWEKVQRNEKVDETKLKVVKLVYKLCHPAGCTAEMEATPEFINNLKVGGGLVVYAINASSAPVGVPVPLNGFATAYAGAPVDNKQYGDARKALLRQIEERRKHGTGQPTK
jgi:invasion protein IalB